MGGDEYQNRNIYDKASEVSLPGGDSHTFDSFECAIHALAPTRKVLWRQGHRPRRGGGWPLLLLRALRKHGGCEWGRGPRLIQDRPEVGVQLVAGPVEEGSSR